MLFHSRLLALPPAHPAKLPSMPIRMVYTLMKHRETSAPLRETIGYESFVGGLTSVTQTPIVSNHVFTVEGYTYCLVVLVMGENATFIFLGKLLAYIELGLGVHNLMSQEPLRVL